MAKIVHLDSSSSTEEILEIIERDAGVILDNFLQNKFLKQMEEELSPYIDNFKKGKSFLIFLQYLYLIQVFLKSNKGVFPIHNRTVNP